MDPASYKQCRGSNLWDSVIFGFPDPDWQKNADPLEPKSMGKRKKINLENLKIKMNDLKHMIIKIKCKHITVFHTKYFHNFSPFHFLFMDSQFSVEKCSLEHVWKQCYISYTIPGPRVWFIFFFSSYAVKFPVTLLVVSVSVLFPLISVISFFPNSSLTTISEAGK